MNRQKTEDGYQDKSYKQWILSKGASKLHLTEMENIRKGTGVNLRKLWGMNMGENFAYIRRKDMKSLRDITEPPSKSVIVVGGGPSIAIHGQLETLKNSDYHGTLVSCDRMLLPLLRIGVVPDYVLSVDGSPIILKYFKSKLFTEYKDKIKVLVHIASHPSVIRYLYRQKVDLYWFLAHAVYVNEAEVEKSDAIVTIAMTSTKDHVKGVQTLPCAGNVGVGAWAFSWVILKKKTVALIGFDMGYPEGTPLCKTYYFSTFLDETQRVFGKNDLAALTAHIPYEKEYNPILKCYTFTDPVFRGYREMFSNLLDIVPKDVHTYNCTEGGALQNPNLKCQTFKQFLSENPC